MTRKELVAEGLWKQVMVAWAAGLFEGEGSFCFHKDEPKSIQITSTDRDVLNKVAGIFGGSVYQGTRNTQKDHWKDAYVWRLPLREAERFWAEVKPFLGERRLQRGEEFMNLLRAKRHARQEKSDQVLRRYAKIFELRNLGNTHKQIAQELNIDRTTVTKVLDGHKIPA